MKTMLKHILTAAVLCMAAVSCVYPFEPEADNSDSRLVIEGDMLLGSVSTVTLSYLSPLNETEEVVRQNAPRSASVWVESSDGRRYDGQKAAGHFLTFAVDLTDAPSSSDYRLNVTNNDTGRQYVSDWQRPATGSVVIDGVSADVAENKSSVTFKLDIHSDPSVRYFRIAYDEDWEYHSLFKAYVRYVSPREPGYTGPETGYIEDGYYKHGYNYYCWGSSVSSYLQLVSTKDYSESRLQNYPLRTLTSADRRISYLYCITPRVYPMTQDAYEYYDHLNSVTSFSGSLFSPNPSEMRGNIHCVSDEKELVIGYVEVSAPVSGHFFFEGRDLGVYASTKPPYDTESTNVPPDQWLDYYHNGYLPIAYDEIQGSEWADSRCVDCRVFGGTKNKPSFWPNDDE